MKKKYKERFLYEFKTLLKGGLSLKDLLEFLSDDFKKERELLKNNLYEGKTLSQCFLELKVFEEEEIALIKLTEETGNIYETFHELYEIEKDRKDLRGKIISFLIYPSFMTVMTLLYLIFSLEFMVPMMADLLMAMDIREGMIFRMLNLRSFIHDYITILLPLTIVLSLFLILYLLKINIHLRIVLGKNYNLYGELKTVESLYELLRSGKNIVDSLKIVKTDSSCNKEKIFEELNKGESLWESLKHGGFTKNLYALIRINEESGDILGSLNTYIINTRETIRMTMEKRMKLLEPLSLLLVGLVMGFTILSIMGPLMSGFNKIK